LRPTVCVSGGGEGGTSLDMEAPHARNLLKNAARTHHPLHAVLGNLCDHQICLLKKEHRRAVDMIIAHDTDFANL